MIAKLALCDTGPPTPPPTASLRPATIASRLGPGLEVGKLAGDAVDALVEGGRRRAEPLVLLHRLFGTADRWREDAKNAHPNATAATRIPAIAAAASAHQARRDGELAKPRPRVGDEDDRVVFLQRPPFLARRHGSAVYAAESMNRVRLGIEPRQCRRILRTRREGVNLIHRAGGQLRTASLAKGQRLGQVRGRHAIAPRRDPRSFARRAARDAAARTDSRRRVTAVSRMRWPARSSAV